MWRILVALALLCGVASAQPVVSGAPRLRTDCSTNDLLKWNGTSWVCSSGPAVTGSGTANTVTKWASASSIGNSLWTDDGTNTTYATNKFTMASASGNATIAGTLGVTGAITENGIAVLAGAISANVLPKGSGGNLTDSAISDDGTTVVISNRKISDALTTSGTLATWSMTGTGLTANGIVGDYSSSATYNTAGGALSATGASYLMSGSKSGGASQFTQTAALFSSSGADVDVAIRTNSGSIRLNTASGQTGIGYAAGSAPTTQRLAVLGEATATVIGAANTSTSQGSHTGISSALSGTVAAAADRTATGISSAVTVTRASGAANAINKAVLATSTGGQINIAYESTAGDSYLATSSGNVAIGVASAGTISAKLHVVGDVLATTGFRNLSSTGPTITAGTGAPEGAVTAPVGSIWQRTDGGAGTSFCVKESGAGNTGWVCK